MKTKILPKVKSNQIIVRVKKYCNKLCKVVKKYPSLNIVDIQLGKYLSKTFISLLG